MMKVSFLDDEDEDQPEDLAPRFAQQLDDFTQRPHSFRSSYLESYKVIPKRNYYGAYGSVPSILYTKKPVKHQTLNGWRSLFCFTE